MITVYGHGVARHKLRKIETTTPIDAGKRWKAIPHAELVDTIENECTTRGWRIVEQKFCTARGGAEMAGALLLEGVRGVDVPVGQTLALGFLNSNARRKALQITVGTEVACCTNGMCSGNILMSRVHDHTVDLLEEVDTALDKYVEEAEKLAASIARLQETLVTQETASEILLRAGRRKLIGWAAVGRVDMEYRIPTFTEHGMDNSWALLNAFTYAARQNINPMKQMETYAAFRAMLPGVALN